MTDTVIVYYPLTSELEAKAKKFGCARRKKYFTKVNNPFGLKEGIFFTGAGVMAGMSKSIVNFMTINRNTKGEIGDKEWNDLHDYIRCVMRAIATDTIVSAKGKMKGSPICETEYDVEENYYAYDEFFYDKEKKQIYQYKEVLKQ